MKSKLTTGKTEFDDLDDLGSFGDFDFDGDQSYKKSGKPASPIISGIKEALRSKLTDRNTYRNMVGKAMPKEWGEIFDTYTDTHEGVREIANDVKRELRGPTNELARAMRKNIPTKMRRTAKTMDALIEKTSLGKEWRRDEGREREESIGEEMRQVFESALADKDRVETARRDEDAQLQNERDLLGMRFQNKSLKVFNSIARSVAVAAAATTGYQLAASKKNLQLQYKQTFLLGDILATLGASSRVNESLLNRIVANTALPDVQKNNLARSFKGALRDKFNNTVLGNESGLGGNIFAGTLKNAKSHAGLASMTAGMGLSSLASGLDSDDDFDFGDDGLTPEQKRNKKIAKALAGFMIDQGGHRVAKAGMKYARGKSRRVDAFAKRAGGDAKYFTNNMNNVVRNALEDDEGNIPSALRETLAMLLPGRKAVDRKLAMHSGETLMSATSFDNMSKRSITEVIPGYLAKILQELQIGRTGKAQPEFRFDYKSGTFKTTNALSKSLLSGVGGSANTMHQMDKLIEAVEDGGEKMSDEQAKLAKKAILGRRLDDRALDPKLLANSSMWTNEGLSPKEAKAMAERFAAYFDNDKNNTRKGDLFSMIAEAAASAGAADPRKAIQHASSQGHTDLMQQAGWLDEKGDISRDRMLLSILGYEGGNTQGEVRKEERQFNGFDIKNRLKAGVENVKKDMKKRQGQEDKPDTRQFFEDYMIPGITPEGVSEQSRGRARASRREINHTRNTNVTNVTKNFSLTGQEGIVATVTDIRDILKAGFENIKAGIDVRLGSLGEKFTAMPVFNVAGDDEDADHLKSSMDPESFKRMSETLKRKAQRARKTVTERMKGWRDRTMGENLGVLGEKLDGVASKAKEMGAKGVAGAKWTALHGLDTLQLARTRAKSQIKSLQEYDVKDLVGGLPEFADIFVEGAVAARIIGVKIQEGAYRTASGKVLKNVKEIAAHAGDIYDEKGQIVMTAKEKVGAYTAKSFRTFGDKLASLASKAYEESIRGLQSATSFLGNRVADAKNLLNSTVMKYGKELLVPPQDVYVQGESEPRLFAWKMRAGLYTNIVDGTTISWPAQIKGPVAEAIDGKPNIVLSGDDFTRGIHDSKGQPFELMAVRAAKFVKKSLAGLTDGFGKLAGRAGGAALAGGKMAGRGIRGAGVLATGGLNGLLYGADGNVKVEGSGGMGAGGINLLADIRNILNERLPGGKRRGRGWGKGGAASVSAMGGMPSGGWSDTPGEKFAPPPTNAGTEVRSNDTRAQTHTEGALGQLAGGAIGIGQGLFQKAKNAFKRRRRGKGGGSTADALGISEDDFMGPHQPEKESKGGLLGKITSLLGGLGSTKAGSLAKSVGESVAKATGGASGGEDKPKYNSAADRLAKMQNKNAANMKTHADFAGPEHFDQKNTFDLIGDVFSKAKDTVSSLFDGAADLLDGGGDDRKKRGRKGRGKAGRAGRAAKGAGRRGLIGRAAGLLGDAGSWVANKVAGAPGRAASWGKFGRGVMSAGKTALGFLGKRGLVGALGAVGTAIGSVLGAPVIGPAIAIAGAAWTAYEVYKLIAGDDKKSHLTFLRMLEYGFGAEDKANREKVAALEGLLQRALKVDGDKVSFDDSRVDMPAVLKVVGINEGDDKRISSFGAWIDQRFKPVLSKWSAAAAAVKAPLEKIDGMPANLKKQLLEVTGGDSTGWDVTANPFALVPLPSNKEQIQDYYKNLRATLDEEIKKGPKEEDVRAEMAKTPGQKTAAMVNELAGAAGTPRTKDVIAGNTDAERLRQAAAKQVQWDADGSAMASLKTLAIPALPSNTLDALGAVRIYAYGLTTITKEKLRAISALESETQEFVKVDKDGKAQTDLKLETIYRRCSRIFGLNPSDKSSLEQFRKWFEGRFLPVFQTYYAQLKFHTGANDIASAITKAKPSAALATARAVIGMNVWGKLESPWGADYQLGSDPAICNECIQVLESKAANEKVEVEKNATQQNNTGQKGVDTSRVPVADAPLKNPNPNAGYGTNAGGMVKTSFKPGGGSDGFTSPDAEKEPRGGGGGERVSTSGGSFGKIPSLAGGELATGAGGASFVKYQNGATLDGANPEMVRLFMGMVEEYGQLTGKKIQVNSGFRTFEQQAAEYRADPSKAARPGSSLHEFGLAIDINSADANELERLGLMRKYGFTRPVGGEPWHIEPAGLQSAIAQFKKDKEGATLAIKASVGRGGGGVGQEKGLYKKGARSPQNAKMLFELNSKPTDANEVGAKSSYARTTDDVKTGVNTQGGSYGGTAAAATNEGDGAAKPSVSSGSYASGMSSMRGSRGAVNTADLGSAESAAASRPNAQAMNAAASGANGDMKQLVHATASQIGLDPKVAMLTVALESGFKSSAAAGTSSAKGLYQFTGGTWKDMVKRYGAQYGIDASTPPTDPKANAIMGALFTKENLGKAKRMGVPENPMGLYTMHFLGASGASKFWSLPDDSIPARVMPKAANDNRPVFYGKNGAARTKAEMIQYFQERMGQASASLGIKMDTAGQVNNPQPAGGKEVFDDGASLLEGSKDASMTSPVYRPRQEKQPGYGATINASYRKEPPPNVDTGSSMTAMPIASPASSREAIRSQNDQAAPSVLQDILKANKEHASTGVQQLRVLEEIRDMLKEARGMKKEAEPEATKPSSTGPVERGFKPPKQSVLDMRT